VSLDENAGIRVEAEPSDYLGARKRQRGKNRETPRKIRSFAGSTGAECPFSGRFPM
jgi:hypothetical protein